MDFDERYKRAMAQLGATSIVEGNYAPPMHNALRKFGYQVRPPHYSGFGMNMVMTGVPFAILWGLLMWLIVWQTASLPYSTAFVAAGAAGLLFGFGMAIYYRASADKHKLDRWEDL